MNPCFVTCHDAIQKILAFFIAFIQFSTDSISSVPVKRRQLLWDAVCTLFENDYELLCSLFLRTDYTPLQFYDRLYDDCPGSAAPRAECS